MPNIVLDTLETGLIYGLIALGIYLTFRIIDFPDLTVNSSFTLGASVATVMITNGINCIIATVCATIAGFFAGAATAFLNVQCKIQNLLSSIIVMIGLTSVSLRIMGKPNLVLWQQEVIYTSFNINSIMITTCIVVAVAMMLAYFLSSEVGLGIRISGRNPIMGNAYGVNHNNAIYTVLIISNGLVALSGALLAQLQGFCDIGMGNGIIVIGLASVIIGERMTSTKKISMLAISCLCGAVIYNVLIAISLNAAGSTLLASDIHIITAILMIFIMISKKDQERSY